MLAGEQRPRKGKAWTYVPPAGPGLDQLASPEGRRRFVRYWVAENLSSGFDIFMFYLMKLLAPLDTCSNFGARLSHYVFPRWHKRAEERARANLRRLLPAASETEREAIWVRNRENQGRLITEFSIIARLARSKGRIRVHGLDNLLETVRHHPTIITGMHLGNWEILHGILQQAGISAAHIYMPPASRAGTWIAGRVRQSLGTRLLPPGKDAIPLAVAELKRGGVVLMYCDEGLRGRIRSPLLGRKPHLEGNLGVAVRLARVTGAKLCPWYAVRGKAARFDAYFLAPVALPAEERPRSRLLEDVALLNSVIELVILDHLDQWYFLDNELVEG